MLQSREKTLDLITGALKMDKESAADTYKVVEVSFNDTGIPSAEGIGNIIRAIKAEGRLPIGISHSTKSPIRASPSRSLRS